MGRRKQPGRKSFARMVTYRGKEYRLCNLAREKGVRYSILMDRIRKGWTVEDAVEIPVGGDTKKTKRRKLTYRGVEKSLKDWARHYGIDYNVLYGRVRRLGWDLDRALTTPTQDAYNSLERRMNYMKEGFTPCCKLGENYFEYRKEMNKENNHAKK